MCSAYEAQQSKSPLFLRPYTPRLFNCILIFDIIDVSFHFPFPSREGNGVGWRNNLLFQIISKKINSNKKYFLFVSYFHLLLGIMILFLIQFFKIKMIKFQFKLN